MKEKWRTLEYKTKVIIIAGVGALIFFSVVWG